MKKEKREFPVDRFLSMLTAAAIFTVAYPIYAIIIRVFLELPFEEYVWKYLLLTEAVGFAGYGVSALTANICRKDWQRKLLLFMSYALVGVGVYFASRELIGMDVAVTIIAIIVSLLIYQSGYGMYEKSLARSVFALVTGIYLLPNIVFIILKYEYAVAPFLLMYLALAAIYAVSENSLNMEFLMKRRGHRSNQMPNKIRRMNLLLLGIMFVLVIVGVLLGDVVLEFFGDFAKSAIRALNDVISFIRGLFPDSGEVFDVSGSNDAAEMPSFGAVEESNQNPFFIYVLMIVVFGTILMVFGKNIKKFIVNTAKKAIEKFRKWIAKNVTKNELEGDGGEYYTDVDETISDESGGTMSRGREMRLWKKQLKEFLKMPDGKEKFLFGYALSARGLRMAGVEIGPDCTAIELCEKSREMLKGDAFDAATYCLNELRFGELDIKPETEKLIAALSEIKGLKKPKTR